MFLVSPCLLIMLRVYSVRVSSRRRTDKVTWRINVFLLCSYLHVQWRHHVALLLFVHVGLRRCAAVYVSRWLLAIQHRMFCFSPRHYLHIRRHMTLQTKCHVLVMFLPCANLHQTYPPTVRYLWLLRQRCCWTVGVCRTWNMFVYEWRVCYRSNSSTSAAMTSSTATPS